MNKRALGILAGLVSSAVGAWYMARYYAAQTMSRGNTPARERGTVIFDNTPVASEKTDI